ncbi:DUF2855 family protein [Phreatobacter stygius]|uniref:DUF2855 family protein n=1 Tax=Phreatobacter stygius TaxID=1940610 RepID=A0A4D7B837_9HYPH|nr:DUF2855 family protein [Phreatobacter stygius]QCI66580.1 DUF2855 family protein [Phreatobacter stygius]
MDFDRTAKIAAVRAAGGFSGFRVAKDNLRQWSWHERDAPDSTRIAAGQIVVAITKFAFTANNVSYARLGDQIAYWRFFPAEDNWGCIPVWGLGDVVGSRHPEVHEGERIYGYFPMATHLPMQPDGLRGTRFVDATAHRNVLPPTYNEYVLVNRDGSYERTHEDAHLVLRPLFSLSFFCSEFLKDARFFGARQIIISSASSKTALGLAFLLARIPTREFEIIGLTSGANADFVRRRGVYDRVVGYDAISSLSDAPAVFIDIAGDSKVQAAVHGRMGNALQHSARVGLTHWDAFAGAFGSAGAELPGPAPTLFFTPDHIIARRKEWGADLLRARLAEAWHGFLGYVGPWLVVEHSTGRDGLERIYRDVLDGRTAPEKAHVLSIGAS